MKPALLLHPHISSYGMMMLLGFFFGWLLVRHRAPLYGILKTDLDNISLLLPFAGFFGARFFARLFYAKLPLLESLKVWEGDGLVFYGGFIFGIATVVIYGLAKRLNLLSLMDCCAPGVAVGLAFGRIGCFLAGCCFGDVCVNPHQLASMQNPAAIQQIHTIPMISAAGWPMAVQFPPDSEAFKQHVKLGLISPTSSKSLPIHPVQLYEAVLAAVVALAVHRATRKMRLPGTASIALLLGYAFIRFATEFLRADNKVYAFHLTFSQVVSVWIALVCFALLALRAFLFGRARVSLERAAEQSELIRA